MIALVAGSRSNFMRIAPIRRALVQRGVPVRVLDTSQHLDASLGELDMPQPDVVLVTEGSCAGQTAAVRDFIQGELMRARPRLLVVAGGVMGALATLAAGKVGVPVAHVDAGLRSQDWSTPDEINRVLIDQLADLLFVSTRGAADDLYAEGAAMERMVFAGNVMIDSLYGALGRRTDITARLGLRPRGYAVATLSQPERAAAPSTCAAALDALDAVAALLPTVFPLHPQTTARFDALGLGERLRETPGLLPIELLRYDDFVTLISDARLAVTNSGGVQEETTVLGVPCLTLRSATERAITVSEGTNLVVGMDPERIALEVEAILVGRAKRGRIPEGWDGRAGERIVDALVRDGWAKAQRGSQDGAHAGHPAQVVTW